MRRVSSQDIVKMKAGGVRIVAVTAYDYSFARHIDEAGADMILVGDSLGMVVYGHKDTLRVTMEQMIAHTRAVVRGSGRAFVVADMPFMSYQVSVEEGMKNAGRLISETGASAVKFEGSHVELASRLTDIGIPVVGHLGYTPQSARLFGRDVVRGKGAEEKNSILERALALQEAGISALVIESVPESLGGELSRRLNIPVIGIGSGRYCDGEIQVCYDILGLYPDFTPKHSKIYKNMGRAVKNAVKKYVSEVRTGDFPAESNVLKF